ncbi:DHHA1 domain-containing protein [Treponema sp.]
MSGSDAFTRLLSALDASNIDKSQRRLIIQPHDHPDHDAVAAAFALSRLLTRCGYDPQIMHRGRLRSHSLQAMVSQLNIAMEKVRGSLSGEDSELPCIIVDASPNNVNAKPLTSQLVGVIDHHPNPGMLDCLFSDIRTSYGACSSIIADYWQESGYDPDKETATALLMGIQMDTDFLSRRVSPSDLDAHHRLFLRADWEFGTRLVKASLSIHDLPAFEAAVSGSRTEGLLFFTVVPMACSQELISIMADFFLRLKEICVTVIIESGGERPHVSVRSRVNDISARSIVKLALAGIGEGGGHDHMAGGVLSADSDHTDEYLFDRFIDAVETAQENE